MDSGGRSGAVRKSTKHLVCLCAAAVELAESLAGIARTLVKLHDAAARVLEAGDIIQTSLNEDLVGLLWLRVHRVLFVN